MKGTVSRDFNCLIEQILVELTDDIKIISSVSSYFLSIFLKVKYYFQNSCPYTSREFNARKKEVFWSLWFIHPLLSYGISSCWPLGGGGGTNDISPTKWHCRPPHYQKQYLSYNCQILTPFFWWCNTFLRRDLTLSHTTGGKYHPETVTFMLLPPLLAFHRVVKNLGDYGLLRDRSIRFSTSGFIHELIPHRPKIHHIKYCSFDFCRNFEEILANFDCVIGWK